jgi:hypothetical protein
MTRALAGAGSYCVANSTLATFREKHYAMPNASVAILPLALIAFPAMMPAAGQASVQQLFEEAQAAKTQGVRQAPNKDILKSSAAHLNFRTRITI